VADAATILKYLEFSAFLQVIISALLMQFGSFSLIERRRGTLAWLACLALLAAIVPVDTAGIASAQSRSPRAPKGYRKLGPGAETTISAQPDPQDTVTRHDMVEIQSANDQLNWKPEAGSPSKTLRVLTKDIPFRRDVWYLQFSFKPLRMINVDMPTANGRTEKRLIWYMVYRVTNLGEHLAADAAGANKQAADQPSNEEVNFHPQFVLESHEYKKAYLDRVLPQAVKAIQKREDPNRVLLDTVQMSQHPIPLSTADEDKSVWGVATWEFVDPRMDFFSIYVKGLTNAYRFADQPGAYKNGDAPGTGRVFAQKTLKLNFWHPGDSIDPREDEIFYGIPDQVDHEWVFR
jgi:hypothetical protein